MSMGGDIKRKKRKGQSDQRRLEEKRNAAAEVVWDREEHEITPGKKVKQTRNRMRKKEQIL